MSGVTAQRLIRFIKTLQTRFTVESKVLYRLFILDLLSSYYHYFMALIKEGFSFYLSSNKTQTLTIFSNYKCSIYKSFIAATLWFLF